MNVRRSSVTIFSATVAAVALGLSMLSGCGAGEQTRFATWSGVWPHTDKGYQGEFRADGGCLRITVDGVDHLAVLPRDGKVEGGRVKASNHDHRIGEKVTIGGAGMTPDQAEKVTSVTVPSECKRSDDKLWLLSD